MSKLFKMSKEELANFKKEVFTGTQIPEELEKNLEKYTYEELSSANILISLEYMMSKFDDITDEMAKKEYNHTYRRRIENKFPRKAIVYNIIAEYLLNEMGDTSISDQRRELIEVR